MFLKRIKYLIVFLTSIIFLTSCQGFVGGTVKDARDIAFEISVQNFISDTGKSARLLSPDEVSPSSIKKYILEGISNYETFSRTIEISNGEATVTSVNPSIWNLTLHAYSDEGGTNEILRGYALADNRYQTANVEIYLSADDLTEKGNLDITFRLASNASVCEKLKAVQVGLYDMNTGAIVPSNPVNPSDKHNPWAILNTDIKPLYLHQNGSDWEIPATSNDSDGINYKLSNLEPGCYFLNFAFFADEEMTKQCGFFSETVVIEPGRTTSNADGLLIPDIINKIPNAPSSFKAYLDDSSCSDGYYSVVFSWDDNSPNEQYFKISVMEYTDRYWYEDEYGTEYKTYDGNTLEVSPEYVDGSLRAGSTSCAIRFPTGKLFDAKISAVNSIGESESLFRIASSDITSSSTDETEVALYNKYGTLSGYDVGQISGTTYENAPYHRINCVQLKYLLNGGSLFTSENTILSNVYSEYYIYSGVRKHLLELEPLVSAGEVQTYPMLYCTDGTERKQFAKWVSANNGSNVQITENDWLDVSVIALYTESIFSVSDDRITITYSDSNSVTQPSANSCKNASVPSGKYVTIAIAGNGSDTFTQYKFYVNDSLQDSVSSVNTEGGYTLFTFQTTLKGSYKIRIGGITSASSLEYHIGTYTLTVN